MTIYGYVRVSTSRQTEGDSLDTQQRQLDGYAMQHGWTLAQVFREDVSGSVPLAERVEGAKLLALVKPGDAIVAAKLDRVFRSALDALQMVEELQRRRVSLHLLDLGGDVSGNGMSKLFLTIAAAFAEAERARIRERVSQAKRDQRQQGRYLGGKVPFGFKVGKDGKLVEDAAEQAIILHARDLRAKGATLRAVQAAIDVQHDRALSLDALHRVLGERNTSTATVDHPTPSGNANNATMQMLKAPTTQRMNTSTATVDHATPSGSANSVTRKMMARIKDAG